MGASFFIAGVRATALFISATLLLALSPERALAAPGIRDLVEITDIDSLAVSPDGRQLAFRTVKGDVERNSYALQWHSLALATGEVRSIAGGGSPIYTDPGLIAEQPPVWTPDGDTLIFRALVDGVIGVWSANVHGGSIAPLVVRDEDVESLALSHDGKTLIYDVGPSREQIRRAERDEYDSGILVDASVDLAQNLFRGGWVDGRLTSQRLVGYWFVRGGLLWRYPRQERRYDLATRSDEPIGQPEPVRAFAPPSMSAAASAQSADGDHAEAVWDGRSGSISAVLNGGSSIRCADPLCTSGHVSALVWRPGTRQLLVSFIDRNRRQSLYLWDAGSNALRLVTRSDGLLSGGRRSDVPCALSASAAFCVAAEPASPPRLERIDLERGGITVLFDPNRSWRASYAPKVEQLMWKLRDGRMVAATLLTPSGSTGNRLPLFINYYSCTGFLRGGEGDEWPIPSLLDAGFAVACVNAVPFTGPQDGEATYRTGLEAVSSMIGLLDRRALIDRRKVGMGGFSFGSEVATWVAIHSKLLSALSIASAQSDPAGYWLNAIGGGDRTVMMQKVWGLGRPEETSAQWKRMSAALNAERISAPTLLQLPEQEARRIPEFYARLTQSRTPAELYAFPDEDHVKIEPRHRLAAYQRNLDWFRYWLQGYRDENPSKVGQYARWSSKSTGRP